MKNLSPYGAKALLAAVLLTCSGFMAGCTAVNEEQPADDASSSAVYILPSVSEAASSESAENQSDTADYVFSTLDESEQAAYNMLLEAVRSFEPSAVFPADFDRDKIKKIFTLVYTQESRIFQLDSIFYSPDENNAISLFYRYDSAKTAEMRAELDIIAGNIIGSLPDNCSEYEAVKLFHDTIIKSCSFSKDGDYVNNAYGVFVDKKAQCEGYAFAMSYLCDAAGIKNYVVTGTDKDGNSHAWNKIFVDGEWYNADCTWDDPRLKYENPDYIRHDYLFVPDPEIVGITHFPDESLFTPLPCTASDDNYFIKEGLYFSNADDGIASLSEQIHDLGLSGQREAEIRFGNPDAYNEANQRLFDNGEFKDVIEKLNGQYGLKIKSAHKNVNDSMYIIHISLIYENDN